MDFDDTQKRGGKQHAADKCDDEEKRKKKTHKKKTESENVGKKINITNNFVISVALIILNYHKLL